MRVLAALVLGCTSIGCTETDRLQPVEPGAAQVSKPKTASPPASFKLPLPGSALSLRGDGLYPDAANTSSLYTDGTCGVTAHVFNPNPTQDAVMQTDNPTSSDQACEPYGSSAWPRNIAIDYGDVVESNAVTLNVHDLGSVVGTELRAIGIAFSGGRCGKLQFGYVYGGDKVWVAATAPGVWHVYSQAAPNNTAVCVNTKGHTITTTTYTNMNVDFTVTTP